jgi:hypothetical protein
VSLKSIRKRKRYHSKQANKGDFYFWVFEKK